MAPDVEDWGAEYRIVVQVNGVTGADIRMEVRGSELGVRAESGGEEGSQLDFTVQIPSDVERDFILAEVNSNVLTIVLPKAEPRLVTVETVDDPTPQPEEEMDAEPEGGSGEPERRRTPVEGDLEDWGCEYRLTQDAQGVSLDEVSVQIKDGRLSVSIRGDVEKECAVPHDVVVDGVHAEVNDKGAAVVVLPKSQGRFIPVSMARAAPSAPVAPTGDEGPSGVTDVVQRTEVITLSDTDGQGRDGENGGNEQDESMREYNEEEGWVDVDVPPRV